MAASDQVGALLLRIAHDETTPPAVRVAAIKDVLDRAGVTVKQEVEVTVHPWQELVAGIVSEVPDAAVRGEGAFLVGLTPDDVIEGHVVRDVPCALPPAALPTAPTEVPIPSRRKRGTRLGG